MATVTVLGTGKMGAGLARQLAAHGHDVRAWNRSREKAEPLAEAGISIAADPIEAVSGADVVVTMLFDVDSVLRVLDEAADGFTAGTILVQTTTVGLDLPRIAEAAERLQLRFLDSPVLGTRQPAEEGKLVVLAAGDPSLRDAVDPILDAIGSRTVWVGDEPGSASRLKLAVNAWLASITAATAQSVALARGLGLDPSLFLEAIDGGPTNSPYAQLKGKAMVSGDMPVAFDVEGLSKDLGLIRAAADEGDVNPDLLDTLLALFARTADAGHGHDDIAQVIAAF